MDKISITLSWLTESLITLADQWYNGMISITLADWWTYFHHTSWWTDYTQHVECQIQHEISITLSWLTDQISITLIKLMDAMIPITWADRQILNHTTWLRTHKMDHTQNKGTPINPMIQTLHIIFKFSISKILVTPLVTVSFNILENHKMKRYLTLLNQKLHTIY